MIYSPEEISVKLSPETDTIIKFEIDEEDILSSYTSPRLYLDGINFSYGNSEQIKLLKVDDGTSVSSIHQWNQ